MTLQEAVKEIKDFHTSLVAETTTDDLCVGEVVAAFEVMTVNKKGGNVGLVVTPLSFGRSRQRGVTAGSTVKVTYKNPDCPKATAAEAGEAAELE